MYLIFKKIQHVEGARAAREDQTEGGQMAGQKETPGLSEPSSGW